MDIYESGFIHTMLIMVVYDVHRETLCKWEEAGGGSESSKQLWSDVVDLEDKKKKETVGKYGTIFRLQLR